MHENEDAWVLCRIAPCWFLEDFESEQGGISPYHPRVFEMIE